MNYQLFPFKFETLNEDEISLSNEAGEFCFISNNEFQQLINHDLSSDSETYLDLKAKQIIAESCVNDVIDMMAVKLRTKKSFLDNFTALHMVVPTLRCNSNCVYCQVSRKNIDSKNFDMSKATAKKIINMIFKSPSPSIKIEFQGGEPLLNFNMVKYIIEQAEGKNTFKKRNLEFVICSNLSLMTEDMLKYLKKHNVYISTSLDGSSFLHNKNRPLQGGQDSYHTLIEKINLCRNHLGHDHVSALMTTSMYNLYNLKEVVDEYIKQNFNAIFLRSLNPYGFAKENNIDYDVDKFVENYKETLDYVIQVNMDGYYIVEGFATILLSRILTPFATGFVDMQFPAGAGIGGAIYDYNGNVYVSDEGRMLASMGDEKFLMGNVHSTSYDELFNSNFLKSLIRTSCLECTAACVQCAFSPYCGFDPVRNYSEQGNIIGHIPSSNLCRKNKQVIKYVLELIKKNDKNINEVFWSWITRKPPQRRSL